MATKEESEASETQQPGHSFELRQDGLIEKLVPDPATPPDAMVLSGLVGHSMKAGYWRLYLTLQLNDYVEFSEKDVLHHQQVPPELNPLGGTLVWLRREANVLHTRTTTQQVQGQFLQGNISSGFLPQAAIENLFGIGQFTTHVCINASRHICPLPLSVFDLCSLFIVCL
jgi:hypothetical protein